MAKVKKKRIKKNITTVKVFISATFNNTIISITDLEGAVLAAGSGGSVGFKGSKKSTPFAAQEAGKQAALKALDYGVQIADVFVKGPGPGRETAIRAIQAAGITVRSLKDITPVPHNGCRPKKRRRV